MKERVPNRYNPEQALELWGKLPQDVKNVINCEYKIRDPELTEFQRSETRQLHQELQRKMSENNDHAQAYVNFMEIATSVFGPMPPIPNGTGTTNR